MNALGIAPAGYKFSLPTETQWEYAARGGKGNADRDGAEPESQYDLALGAMATGVPPVKSFPPNALGLYDMTCGVYELLQDGLAGTEYFDAKIMWAPSTGLRLALVRE
ncbi:MAG: SUMF1/EgtB/PvdO family nonheme iron enzyme [Thermoguttaceae bacterium]|nr:SUMF1/EgtB/PvdO family nonheme iron enzyme [Thermoguttaceae bacterium]